MLIIYVGNSIHFMKKRTYFSIDHYTVTGLGPIRSLQIYSNRYEP